MTDSTTHSGSARTTDAKPMHTPGPWAITGESIADGSLSVSNPSLRYVVATVHTGLSLGEMLIGKPPTLHYADAHLIAAAPDLFAALQIIAELPMPEQDDMVAANMRAIARTALSRTTGDSA